MAKSVPANRISLSVFRRDGEILRTDDETSAPIDLIFAGRFELAGALDADAIDEFHRRCRQGGSIVMIVDEESLTDARDALEACFKQLRYIQVVTPSSGHTYHPADVRLMALIAVRGGSSTFNSIYNNGRIDAVHGEAALKTLIHTLVPIHSNDGFRIATQDPEIADLLGLGGFAMLEKPQVDQAQVEKFKGKKKASKATSAESDQPAADPIDAEEIETSDFDQAA